MEEIGHPPPAPAVRHRNRTHNAGAQFSRCALSSSFSRSPVRRVGFRDDDGRELAFAEFTEQGDDGVFEDGSRKASGR